MEIISNTVDFYIEKPTAVAIGKFDGVHVGHRRLLDEVIAQKEKGLLACVFTFDPPPSVLFGKGDSRELSTRREKRELFEELGMDILIEFPLTMETAAIEPKDFVIDILAGRMNAALVVAGTDLSFGAGGRGNAELLSLMGEEMGFGVRTIEKVCVGGIEVSSTYARSLVSEGRMEQVEQLLGMAYSVSGTVMHGNHIGTGIGFPTVNVLPEEGKMLPPNGVYYSNVVLQGVIHKSVTNVGVKPTIEKNGHNPCGGKLTVESFIYDFDRDVYGDNVRIEFLSFRRPEMKFAGLEELKAQIRSDVEEGRKYFGLE